MSLRSLHGPWLVGLSLVAVFGCGNGELRLSLDDLNAAERRYVTQFVVLERARAVALADPPVGAALMDSLALAWGDSAGVRTLAGLTDDPRRAAALHDLLARLIDADLDSLTYAPDPRRLAAPLPDPDTPTDVDPDD